jgi:phospholipid/cholesterol/gamma-HCH transport system substrate-binding protein
MRRLAVIATVLAAAATVLVLGTGASDGGGNYQVRAIFDNAVSVIPGEDLKISGVKVGRVQSIDTTGRAPNVKAALVLSVVSPGFQDFRADATCTIRPQSLIGEKFVECMPTQPRAPGAQIPPPLPKIKSGQGKGQHLVPVTQTTTPVDIDLINNILRRPYAERLSLILGELGTTVAGRGADLNSVIRRADPALQQTDKVLNIIAQQNKTLADLARDSDASLGPLAASRRQVADQFTQVNTVAEATASQGAALERNFQLFPPFLRELQTTSRKLGNFADQAAPVFEDLGAQAPSINRFFQTLGPFSNAAIPAFQTLGRASTFGTPAAKALLPTTALLQKFAAQAKPAAANLGALTSSLKNTGGVERLLDYIFYQAAAVNGFDAFGHYLRAALVVNTCSTYAAAPVPGCSANFTAASSASTRVAASGNSLLQRAAAAVRGQPAPSARPTGSARGGASAPASSGNAVTPSVTLPGQGVNGAAGQTPQQQPTSGGAAAQPTDPKAGLFNYLLGNDGQ